MIDSGAWITEAAPSRPAAWNKAFSKLTTIATQSELFQMDQLGVVDDSTMQASEIGHRFYVVVYNSGFP